MSMLLCGLRNKRMREHLEQKEKKTNDENNFSTLSAAPSKTFTIFFLYTYPSSSRLHKFEGPDIFLQKQKIKRTIWALNVQNICYNKNKFDILYMYNFAQKI